MNENRFALYKARYPTFEKWRIRLIVGGLSLAIVGGVLWALSTDGPGTFTFQHGWSSFFWWVGLTCMILFVVVLVVTTFVGLRLMKKTER